MSAFADVEQFAREHAGCGGLTPQATSRPGREGYHLTVTCACGATHDRWVTAEEASQPLPRPSPRPAPAPMPAAPPAFPVRPPAPRPQRVEVIVPAGRASRGRAVWLVLLLLVVLAATAAAYLTGVPDVDGVLGEVNGLLGRRVAAPSAPPTPRPSVAVPPPSTETIARALRDLHSSITPSVSLNDYASRVASTRVDVERQLATAPDPARAQALEALEVHRLAVSAWRARTLDDRDEWEHIGQDPAVALCPAVKRAVEAAVPSRGVSRAQARGAAVAASLSMLWECAAEKAGALAARPAAPAARPSGA
jgi:hypothetical protein